MLYMPYRVFQVSSNSPKSNSVLYASFDTLYCTVYIYTNIFSEIVMQGFNFNQLGCAWQSMGSIIALA